jgi:hypothetical protein
VDVGDFIDFGFVIQEHLCVFVGAPVGTSPTLMTVHSEIVGVGVEVEVEVEVCEMTEGSVSKIQ